MIKDSNKRLIINILFIIACFTCFSFIKPWINYSKELKHRMSYDFEGFGTDLENANEQISQILKLNSYNKEKDIINRQTVLNFHRSNSSSQNIGEGNSYENYFTLYLFANEVIQKILADELITSEEKIYLESLYSYNEELIVEYKSIVGTAYNGFDFGEQEKLEKNIVKIYNNYSKKSGELLDTEKYSFIKDYRGNFSGKSFNEVNVEDAKKYCEEVFSKLFKAELLQIDNSSEINEDVYIFKTKLSSKTHAIADDPVYSVEYNKKTKQISIYGGAFSVPNYGHTEQDLDNTAKEIILKFSDNTFRYDKKINYETDTKIRSIEYSYIEKVNGIYDEMKKIKICLERNGLMSRFEIVYPYDEKIIAPTISKDEILKKIKSGSEVLDVLTIRNIQGEIEYEVHLKYINTIYVAVFDGQKGDLKYYGREIRNYKLE
ncbi:hypothetical protein [Clostridium sp.]|uniref:hypothetical protein n=1 Tax=Clostridium sp. TaxID=1506 RepID=UPI003D6D6FB0